MKRASVLLVLVSLLGAADDRAMLQKQTAPPPACVVLEQMSRAERENSSISVEFESSDARLLALGREVERLWNGGQYDEALAQLGNLEDRVGRVAIGNSWRTPVPTIETGLWGRDVRIGNRDSLLELAFDTDDSTGNPFAVLRRGEVPHFSVCMSTDSGATWAETFTWNGSPPTALDAAVLANHLYVVYNSPGENAQQVRLRRFLCSNGRADTFQSGRSWVAPCTLEVGDTMREVSLVPYPWTPTFLRLYMYTLASDGSILWSWDDANAVSWVTQSTGITSGASNGLDATANLDSDSTYCFFSYYDTSDTLRIYGRFRQRLSLPTGRGTPTSISAYRDTIICTFEDETSSPHQVRYVINYGDGDTWAIGTLSSADTAAESPGVVASGGRFAAVFRHHTPTRGLRFRQRAYSGPWSDPVSIADNEPYWDRPGIKYLDTSGVFGVVYLSNTSPVVRGAYFDRSDWVYGLSEQRRLIVEENILSVTPNPLSGPGRLSYTLNRAADLRVQVYDRAGRIVRTLFAGCSPEGRRSLGFDAADMAPGMYFIRADAAGSALTVPMTVVK